MVGAYIFLWGHFNFSYFKAGLRTYLEKFLQQKFFFFYSEAQNSNCHLTDLQIKYFKLAHANNFITNVDLAISFLYLDLHTYTFFTISVQIHSFGSISNCFDYFELSYCTAVLRLPGRCNIASCCCCLGFRSVCLRIGSCFGIIVIASRFEACCLSFVFMNFNITGNLT